MTRRPQRRSEINSQKMGWGTQSYLMCTSWLQELCLILFKSVIIFATTDQPIVHTRVPSAEQSLKQVTVKCWDSKYWQCKQYRASPKPRQRYRSTLSVNGKHLISVEGEAEKVTGMLMVFMNNICIPVSLEPSLGQNLNLYLNNILTLSILCNFCSRYGSLEKRKEMYQKND